MQPDSFIPPHNTLKKFQYYFSKSTIFQSTNKVDLLLLENIAHFVTIILFSLDNAIIYPDHLLLASIYKILMYSTVLS